jgi:hypothetical protein
MRHLVTACLLAALLAGCGLAVDPPGLSSSSSPTSATVTTDAAALLARPLKLPAVQPGSACPVTRVAGRKVGVTDPRGHGPFYLSSGGGVSATFYERVIDRGVEGAFYVYPATAGCYALQADGPSFEDVIVISAG